jgi:hypothetical protein
MEKLTSKKISDLLKKDHISLNSIYGQEQVKLSEYLTVPKIITRIKCYENIFLKHDEFEEWVDITNILKEQNILYRVNDFKTYMYIYANISNILKLQLTDGEDLFLVSDGITVRIGTLENDLQKYGTIVNNVDFPICIKKNTLYTVDNIQKSDVHIFTLPPDQDQCENKHSIYEINLEGVENVNILLRVGIYYSDLSIEGWINIWSGDRCCIIKARILPITYRTLYQPSILWHQWYPQEVHTRSFSPLRQWYIQNKVYNVSVCTLQIISIFDISEIALMNHYYTQAITPIYPDAPSLRILYEQTSSFIFHDIQSKYLMKQDSTYSAQFKHLNLPFCENLLVLDIEYILTHSRICILFEDIKHGSFRFFVYNIDLNCENITLFSEFSIVYVSRTCRLHLNYDQNVPVVRLTSSPYIYNVNTDILSQHNDTTQDFDHDHEHKYITRKQGDHVYDVYDIDNIRITTVSSPVHQYIDTDRFIVIVTTNSIVWVEKTTTNTCVYFNLIHPCTYVKVLVIKHDRFLVLYNNQLFYIYTSLQVFKNKNNIIPCLDTHIWTNKKGEETCCSLHNKHIDIDALSSFRQWKIISGVCVDSSRTLTCWILGILLFIVCIFFMIYIIKRNTCCKKTS